MMDSHRIAVTPRALLLSLLLAVSLGIAPAQAQTYPARPVRLVTPFSAGGAADTAARLVAAKLADQLGQPIVVDNRLGAGGILGTEAVAKALPDGQTLLWVNSNHAINASLHKSLKYDAVRDFTTISLIGITAFVLVTHPSLKASNVADLIRLARAKPGSINYASLGNGSGAHFAAELFRMKASVDMTHVPYKGVAQALPDLLAGTVSVMFPNIGNASAHVRANRLRALAVTTTTRSALMPELPTLQESGIADYEFSNWFGLLAPRGISPLVVTRLRETVTQIGTDRDIQAMFARDGATLVASTPDYFAAHMERETRKYAMLVSHIGLKPD